MKSYLKSLLTLLAFLFLIVQQSKTQGLKRQCIGSYGSGGISGLTYFGQTIGQPFFTSAYSENNIGLTPGFQQPIAYRMKTTEKLSINARPGIFPNPAAGIFALEISEVIKNAIVQVIDVNGKLIWKEKVPELRIYQINCSQWADGIYFVSVNNGKEYNYMSKVIISK